MQTIRPLTRNVRTKLIPSPSKIPHISHHIRCKSNQARKIDLCQRSRAQPQRCQSTLLHTNSLSAVQPPAEEQEDSASTINGSLLDRADSSPVTRQALEHFANPTTTTIDGTDFVPDAVDNHESSLRQPITITDLLAEANPERILAWLEFHPTGHAFVSTASDKEFEVAFCAIDPNVLLEPFKEALWHARGQGAGGTELRYDKTIVDRCRSLAQTVDNILSVRQNTDHSLTLPVCRHALKCAASIGNVRMSKHIWEEIMPFYKIKPDIMCYNAYMEAHAWNLAFGQGARHAFRATKHDMFLRSKVPRPKHLWGFSVDPAGVHSEQSLKGSVLALFQGISDKGLSPTEDTFTSLMISLARTGDISGPESILKSVWNIDVNLLDSFDEEEIQSPTFYPSGHPLQPSSKLLWAVVHCYGVTSNGSKAWSLLDYISRNYALQIPLHVWNELIERTYVLSRKRTFTRRVQGYADGQLPEAEVERLYRILTDEPYNLSPTPIISNLLTRSYQSRGLRAKTLQQLQEADKALMNQIESLQFMNEAFRDLSKHSSALLDNGMLSEPFLQLRQKFQMIYLDVRLRLDLLTRQVKRAISKADFVGSGKSLSWERRELPVLIERMCSYVHNHVGYSTQTGEVRLQVRPPEADRLLETDVYQTLYEAHTIWQALKSNNLFEVAAELEQLPDALESAQKLIHLRKRGMADYEPFSGLNI